MKREEAYLLLGGASQRFEAATMLGDKARVLERFDELMAPSAQFHFYSTKETNQTATKYLTALARVVATKDDEPDELLRRMQELNEPRTAAADAMRADVLRWSRFGSGGEWSLKALFSNVWNGSPMK